MLLPLMEERVEKQSEQSLLRKKKRKEKKRKTTLTTTTTNLKETLASVSMGKRVDPFTRAKSARASSDWLNECSRMLSSARLERVDPAGKAYVIIQRNVARLGGVTLPSQKGHRSRRATFLFLI